MSCDPLTPGRQGLDARRTLAIQASSCVDTRSHASAGKTVSRETRSKSSPRDERARTQAVWLAHITRSRLWGQQLGAAVTCDDRQRFLLRALQMHEVFRSGACTVLRTGTFAPVFLGSDLCASPLTGAHAQTPPTVSGWRYLPSPRARPQGPLGQIQPDSCFYGNYEQGAVLQLLGNKSQRITIF